MADVVEKLVMTPAELAACVEHLAAVRRFGLDTEFVGEETYHPHLCLVQLATEDTLYLVDPLTVGPLDAFWKSVVDPGNLVVVHAGREEVRLCQLWSGQSPGQLFDLQIAAGLVGLAVACGELAATVLVMPPGRSGIGVHVFQLLHYGMDDRVAAISLWLAGGMAVTTAIAGAIIAMRRD